MVEKQYSLVAALTLALALALPAGAQAEGIPHFREPAWAQLTPQQRQVLAPLGDDWNRLEDLRKRKWLGIADRFLAMTQDEQDRVQSRMREWAKLTPEERRKARERYRNWQKKPASERYALKQKWSEYAVLPDEEKRRLAAEAKAPPARQLASRGNAKPLANPRPQVIPQDLLPKISPAARLPQATPAATTAAAASPADGNGALADKLPQPSAVESSR
ncbi:MAG: DUF3106 domain-containing protein [Rhodocyclaceae bacterium]|nr:DUF3106 domain-containing protein [Rhodocyclaceae bacterium]MBX3667436.1 DUF3106 domain-containing protein [Rhodocyclaceae bacterium]